MTARTHALLVVLLAALAASCAPAQGEVAGEIAFQQALRDATTDAVVLNLAAHPDDESARTMVLLRHKYGVRTVTAYATCGEGGQNAVGREIGRRLAAIRARETLRAAERYGTEVRWLGFPDFGYSKSLDETLGVWGEAQTAERIAAVVASIRPDIVVTNHSIDRGHGHHRAVAWAAEKACREQGIPLYQRAWGEAADAPDVFALSTSDVDPLRGETYARQAHEAWTLHESQGPWRAHDPVNVSADRWQQVVPAADRGVEHPLARLHSVFDDTPGRGAERLNSQGVDAAALQRAFAQLLEPGRAREQRLALATELLRQTRAACDRVSDQDSTRRLQRRVDALERAVALGSGAQLEIALGAEELPVGGEITARVRLWLPGAEQVTIRCRDRVAQLPAAADGTEPNGTATDGAATNGSEVLSSAPASPWADLQLSLPEQAADDALLDLTRMAVLPIEASFVLGGQQLSLRRNLAMRLAPDSELSFERPAAYVPAGQPWRRVLSLQVEYRGAGALSAPVRLQAPAGLELQALPPRVELAAGQRTTRVLVRVDRVAGTETANDLDDGPLEIVARIGDQRVSARTTLQPLQLPALDDLHVGLVRGPEDSTQRCLEDLGIRFDLLDEAKLAVAELSDYSTLLLDIRAYQHRPDLAHHQERLLRFCRAGGRIVVCYHKPREWNEAPGKPLLAPFALQVGNQRVSQEDAAVSFLAPEHPLLTEPLRITTDDFAGWVQERGLNFPAERDPAWVPLLSMHDIGEDPLDSSLLYARYGRGDYVYCSLALYRQLRLGHAGAARILLNLLTR